MKQAIFKASFISFLFVFNVSAFAQTITNPASLKQCVDMAIKTNYQAQQGNVSVKKSEINKKQSWELMLPQIGASSAYNYNLGFNFDANTNTRIQNDQQTFNIGASAQLNLFDGLQNINTYRKAQLELLASKYNYEGILTDVTVQTINQYVGIIAAEQYVSVCQSQYELSLRELERVRTLVDSGKAAMGDYYQAEANNASDLTILVDARNQLAIALLTFKQLIGIDIEQDLILAEDFNNIDVQPIEFSSSYQIYEKAYSWYPTIKQAENKISIQKRAIDLAKGAFSPTLSFSYGVYDSFIFNYITPMGQKWTIGEQWKDNVRQSLSFNLNIPIFSKMQNINNLKLAKLSYQYEELGLLNVSQNFRQMLERAYLDAVSAHKSYLAAEISVKANKEALKYAEERYAVGKINGLDFETAKNKLLKAESELIKQKSNYVFKVRLLNYYRDGKI